MWKLVLLLVALFGIGTLVTAWRAEQDAKVHPDDVRIAESDLKPMFENKTIERSECEDGRAFVDASVWARLNVDARANMTRTLVLSCGIKPERATGFRVLDYRSGGILGEWRNGAYQLP